MFNRFANPLMEADHFTLYCDETLTADVLRLYYSELIFYTYKDLPFVIFK